MARQQGLGFVGSYRLTRHAIFLGVTALAVTMADAQRGQSVAQGKLDARYVVTLSGLPIGQGMLVADAAQGLFRLSAGVPTNSWMKSFFDAQMVFQEPEH